MTDVQRVSEAAGGAARLMRLPHAADNRGNLSFVEEFGACPFEFRRLYWIYDVPAGKVRGGHAHRVTEAFMIAVSGRFDVVLDTGRSRSTYTLDNPTVGLYIPKMVWRELSHFSADAVALVLASTFYDAADYEFDYARFQRAATCDNDI